MAEGKHVVIEGGDGSGKSTQARRLLTRLNREGIIGMYFNEPGSSPPENRIRDIMLTTEIDFDPKTRLFLVNAARVETVKKIRDTRELGKWAVSDRSWMSSVAYQGYGDQLDLNLVHGVCEAALGGDWSPELTIVLDVDAAEARRRAAARDKPIDTFEQRQIEWHDRVRQGYLDEAARIGATLVDASAEIEEVEEQIWDLVSPLID